MRVYVETTSNLDRKISCRGGGCDLLSVFRYRSVVDFYVIDFLNFTVTYCFVFVHRRLLPFASLLNQESTDISTGLSRDMVDIKKKTRKLSHLIFIFCHSKSKSLTRQRLNRPNPRNERFKKKQNSV